MGCCVRDVNCGEKKGVLKGDPLWGPQGGVLGAFCLSSDQRYKVKTRRWSLTREYIGAHYKKDSILLLV